MKDTNKDTKKFAKKLQLYGKMVEAVYDYKFENGTKEAARNATEAFAEFCDITYERACEIAMEIF